MYTDYNMGDNSLRSPDGVITVTESKACIIYTDIKLYDLSMAS